MGDCTLCSRAPVTTKYTKYKTESKKSSQVVTTKGFNDVGIRGTQAGQKKEQRIKNATLPQYGNNLHLGSTLFPTNAPSRDTPSPD
jgi:hypothetical protein